MSLTVNQKTKTVEQAVRSRRDFLEQLATSRIWDFRHWAKSSDTAERLDGLIQELARALHEKVAAAELQVLNSNVGFEEVFDSIFAEADTAGEKVAEALWQDGLTAQAAAGREQEALMLMRKAVVARLDKVLCKVEEAGTRRAIEMRTHLVNMQEREGMDQQKDQQKAFAWDKAKLASLLRDVGNFKQALVHYGKAEEVLLAVDGDNSPDVSLINMNIGSVHLSLGDYEKALFHYGKAQEVFVAMYGDVHLDTAMTYNNQGVVYEKLARFDDALEAYSKSLDIKIRVVGQDHLDTAATFNNQGNVYKSMGQYEKALEAYSKSLDITIRVVGQDHPDVARTHLNMGTVHGSLQDHEKALFHFGKAQEVFVAVFGYEHPSLADTKYNMALLHKKRGERHLAKQLYLECEAIYATVYGPDHSKTIDAKQKASDSV